MYEDINRPRGEASIQFESLKGLLVRAQTEDIGVFNEQASTMINSINGSSTPEILVSLSFYFSSKTFPFWYEVKPKDTIESLDYYHMENSVLSYERRATFGVRNKVLRLHGMQMVPVKEGRSIAYIFDNENVEGPNAVVSPAKETPLLVLNSHLTGKINR